MTYLTEKGQAFKVYNLDRDMDPDNPSADAIYVYDRLEDGDIVDSLSFNPEFYSDAEKVDITHN